MIEELIVVRTVETPRHEALVRINSACLLSEALDDHHCDCSWQLSESIRRIEISRNGLLVYVCNHEGRGMGLAAKFNVLALSEASSDSFTDSSLRLGYPADSRDYTSAIRVIKRFSLRSITLLTNNPRKVDAVKSAGLKVRRVALCREPRTAYERREREAKIAHMGHNYLEDAEA